MDRISAELEERRKSAAQQIVYHKDHLESLRQQIADVTLAIEQVEAYVVQVTFAIEKLGRP